MLVGPKSNPANLTDSDDVYSIFNKIVTSGKNDVTVSAVSLSLINSLIFPIDASGYISSSSNSVFVSLRQECDKH